MHKHYTDFDKEKALALLTVDHNYAHVAKETGISQSTLYNWEQERLADVESGRSEKYQSLREKAKEEFIDRAWRIIGKSSVLIEERLDKAKTGEEKIDVKSLSTVLGTIYDKQALATGDPTNIVDGEVEITKFEDL